MPIELSLYLAEPAPPARQAPSPLANAAASVDGGGSRLSDALDLAAALGRVHTLAGSLIRRNANADADLRSFAGADLLPLIELVQDVLRILPGCLDQREGPVRPAAEVLLNSGVCRESGGRLILTRTHHGLFRILDDLAAVSELLSRARDQGCRVHCDFDPPGDEREA